MQRKILASFSVGIIFLDMQFKYMKDRNLLGVNAGIVSRDEYAKQIKRFHCANDKQCRYYYVMLPFNSLSQIIVVHLMITILFCTNAFM